MIRTAIILGLASLSLIQTELPAADNISDLIKNSPFIPEGWTPNATQMRSGASVNQQYIFKGIYTIDEEIYVDIVEGSSGKGTWIRVGDTDGKIRVVSYDMVTNKVVIVADGRELSLEIPKPVANPSPVGLAVNSMARQQKIRANRPGNLPNTRRALRPLPPPPGWANIRKANAAARRNISIGGGSRSSSSGGTTTNDDSLDTGSDTGSNTNNDTDTGSNPVDDPVEETPETPIEAPPAPPNFIPSIPPELQHMINNGTSPENP